MRNLLYFIAIAVFSYVNAIPYDSDSRIANGGIAAQNQFSYAISLQNISQVLEPTRGHWCGGALVTFGHALTAASCLYQDVTGVSVLINPAQFRVFAGSALLTNDTGPDRTRLISNFSIHPSYTGAPAFVHDIGIIILVTPFTAPTVTPLSMPSSSFNPVDFTLCQVAGWGAPNSTTTASPELRFANKYIYSQSLCSSLFNSQYGIPNIRPTMVCAASYDILASGCINDEGNALVCGGTLTGILFITDNCRSSSFPELYTRVSNYTDWVRSISASPALFTPGVFIITAMFSIAQVFIPKY